jgi:predicted dienelactone hydrolase
MHFRKIFISVLFTLAVTGAQAAGVQELQISADAKGPRLQAMIWSPCAAAPTNIKIDALTISGVRGCPIHGGNLALVVISHGLGGSMLGHHDTAQALANSGFIVVSFNHALDSGADMRRANDVESMQQRPTDVSRVITYMLRSSPVAAHIDPRRIGFFGFSRGGYTGLVLAGAAPQLPLLLRMATPVVRWWKGLPALSLQPAPDARIKAFVIADPLNFFPGKDSLVKVTAPAQLWGSQLGGQGVTPEGVAKIAAQLPVKPAFQVVANSTHLSFIFPCPPEIAKIAGEACVDPAGFDRAAFHRTFNAQIVNFFRKTIPAAGG